LANNGKNPLTGKQVIKPEHSAILATMTLPDSTDGSGGWAWSVGFRQERRRRRHHCDRPRQGAIYGFSPGLMKPATA
jgi:hypothetical protein